MEVGGGAVFTCAASASFGEERAMERERNAAAAEARCCCRRGAGGRADGAASSKSSDLNSAPPLVAFAIHLFEQRDLARRVCEIKEVAVLDNFPDDKRLVEEQELEKKSIGF